MNRSVHGPGEGQGPSAASVGCPGAGAGRGNSGLFGPESVSWRVHADPLLGLACLRALLLQELHPLAPHLADLIPAGADTWGRVSRIRDHTIAVTYGSATAAMLAGSRLQAMNRQIQGTTEFGRECNGDDPHFLLWLHCCAVASFLEISTRGGLRLTGPEQDAYVREQVTSATLIGLEPQEVPADRGALRTYFRGMRPLLGCSPVARRTAKVVLTPSPLSPPHPVSPLAAPRGRRGTRSGRPRSLLPVWADWSGLAYAALPPWARRLYALTPAITTAAPGPTDLAWLDEAEATEALRRMHEQFAHVETPTQLCPPTGGRRSGHVG